ncbi:MAG: L-aspartate oxidase [Parachlamydiales bacterium]
MHTPDVLIIGSGLAGCIAALELADKGHSVVLLGSGPTGLESNSAWAQGGIIYQGDGDSAQQLAKDIIEAGAGLSHLPAVEALVKRGPNCVKELLLEKYQVDFDRTENGHLALTEEAAHSCPRIIHHRDQTGLAIMGALIERVKNHPQIQFKTDQTAVDLITLSHHSKVITDIYYPSTCVGAYVMDNRSGDVKIHFAKETILATGGIGEVFLHTSNPKEARGDGLAMAFRAGARIMNMEYIQFHPTTLYLPYERRFLITEALRGEGAELLTIDQSAFMHRYDARGSLAPRDIVARSIYQEMMQVDSQHLWLDISSRSSDWIKGRFPTVYSHCLSKGYDLTSEPIPVVPAAHYSCGGIAVDLQGRTTIHRLRAIGEVACTGVHGANRLASTSLLEALVFSKLCAEALGNQLQQRKDYFPPVEEWVMSDQCVDSALVQQDWTTIKQTMWNYVGLVRDTQRLSRAFKMLHELKIEIDSFYSSCKLTPELLGLRNGIQTALLITEGAIRNRRSIGCHYRRGLNLSQ